MNFSSIFSIFSFFVLFFCFPSISLGQSLQKQKITELSFMIGNWEGTSKSFKNGIEIAQVPAYQSIKFALDSQLIVIDLYSQTLQLHTVIRYDEKDKTYYYYPFSMGGTGKLPATLTDGKLIVKSNETTRYIFGTFGENGFREYGEKLVNGTWVRYFEDTFVPSE